MPRLRLSVPASIAVHKHKIAVTAASCTAVTGAVVGALSATAATAHAATIPVAQKTVSNAAVHVAAHEIAFDDAPARPSAKFINEKPPAVAKPPAPEPRKPAAPQYSAAPAPVPATTTAAQAPAPAVTTGSDPYAGLSAYQIAQQIVPSGEFGCFDWIVSRESGWSVTATNPSSGAYGLGQALPGSKMASAGSDWQTNPVTQIRWTLGYMDERYGSPCAAQSFWEGHNWY
ncbi:MAG TPA: hypothetical protein VGS97_12375 [Actinocrinis sp.]|uniref:aggregation-promoting factor C-terminal-like domain-containing protein n=1 Tax=Actinocrinis sp. TaxID=1920516 RepID=UPI002DDDB0C7|nr:hypothetical protein [Actinocrinis sp.]HEV2344883.1 hypothetical protein [Actinocrinis sp.]